MNIHSEHANLVHAVVCDFIPRFVPDSKIAFIRDTSEMWPHLDKSLLGKLGIKQDSSVKLPDLVLYCVSKNWLLLVDVVIENDQIDSIRHAELAELFANTPASLSFVSAFRNRTLMSRHLGDIAWQAVAWIADEPSHLIHFNGTQLVGPYS